MPLADGPAIVPDGMELAFGLFEYFKLQRERFGTDACKKELVGPLRKRAPPSNLSFISRSPAGLAQEQWARALAAHCTECGGCKWGRPIKGSPP